ncbi:hypothetical protein AAG570_010826 [Ranatra chinensis]|uniref:BTB domain-containing protein n=1 Tax=Ranatra chinensis TaxID=642074 RepID=A0ABD0YIU3_9HEMI
MRRRRASKACDHGRVVREAVGDWSRAEVAALLHEYDALAALRDLSVQAELARPPAPTFKQDLSTLYDFKYCTDVDLLFRGTCFPVHRAILSARCPYFRDLLAGCPGYGARICLELRTPGVDVEVFSALLRYLYTGDLTASGSSIDIQLLRRLAEEFGHPNPLDPDLRYLLETGDYADAVVIFTSDTQVDYHQRSEPCIGGVVEYSGGGGSGNGVPGVGLRPNLELPCHKAILSARSPFFRNLIQRRSRSGEEHTERALHIPTRIVLDESVIPKRYARVLLHAIYLDTVDLSLILRGSGCGSSSGSLSEAEALTGTGRVRPTLLEEAMELYQIGRFLELDIVSQGCEDIILEWLTVDSLPGVLRWASEPHGSAWVLRQARHLLREEFTQVAHSPVLHQLDKSHLIDALSSHFLQASELEVLQAVLKWGEHQLIKRMEDREPNVVSQTAHSVARKGVKKRDLSDVELREILSEVVPLVRMDHVLPPTAEPLANAIRRGLVPTPPTHMLGADHRPTDSTRNINAWVRASRSGLFVRPRLFMPYYEEIKVLVEEQSVNEGELVRVRRPRYIADIPDTLYMVEDKPRATGIGIDVITHAIPVPDGATMAAMLKRQAKLRQSPTCQRALALPLSSRHEINRQIRLRVVREFNLPDAVAQLLEGTKVSNFNFVQNAGCYQMEDEDELGCGGVSKRGEGASGMGGRPMTYPRCHQPPPTPHHTPIPTPMHHPPLPAVVTEGELFRNFSPQWCRVGERGQLSEMMPDVAMATASLGELSLSGVSEGELPLDLLGHPTHCYPPPPPPPPHTFI